MTTSAEPRCPIAYDPMKWDKTSNGLGWTFRCYASGHSWAVGRKESTADVRGTQRPMDAHAATCQEKRS